MATLKQICPGCATVWYFDEDASPSAVWVRLVHVDSWTLTPNRQEATKKRTSDTGGAAVKFCQDITDWTVEVTNTLWISDWIYTDLLENQRNPSVGIEAYFFFGWGCEHAPHTAGSTGPSVTSLVNLQALKNLAYTTSDGGFYCKGIVNPPGLGIDNAGSDPATGDWTVEVTEGPFFPMDDSDGNYTGSDSDPSNTEAS